MVTTQQIEQTVSGYLAGQSMQNLAIQVYQTDPQTGANLGLWNQTPYGGAIAVQIDADYVPILPVNLGVIPNPIHFTAISMMLSEAN